MRRQESSENYLEQILIISKKQNEVRAIDIVNSMNFSKPSVSVAMKNLKQNDCINISEKGLITLTSKGYEIAHKVYERHCVLTKMLIMLGVSEETADNDACRIEHDLSEESFTAIKDYLDKIKH